MLLHQGLLQLPQAEGGYSLVVVSGLLIAVSSLIAEHRFQGTQASVVAAGGSVVVAHRLSCPVACGI